MQTYEQVLGPSGQGVFSTENEYRKHRKALLEIIERHDAADTNHHADPEWRFAAMAVSEWASAVWRETGSFPVNHRVVGLIA